MQHLKGICVAATYFTIMCGVPVADFFGHVCVVFGVCMYTTVVVQLDIYVQCYRYICSGAYASNVKCMHVCVSSHIISCTRFIWDIYTDMVVSYVHLN